MPATTYDFTVEQGGDYTDDFTILDDDGQPINLTGDTFLFEVKDYPFSTTTKLQGTVLNGLLVVTALTGVVTLKLAPSDLALLQTKTSSYVLWRIRPSGYKERVLEGTITSKPWG